MKWIIEEFGQCNNLLNSLKKTNTPHRIISPIEDIEDLYKEEDCILYYGSLNRAQEIRRKARWIPGIYCNFDKLKCSYYYPRVDKYLLNGDAFFLPFGMVEEIVSKKPMFVRPDTGYKLFTGQVLGPHNLKEIQILKDHYNVYPEDMCVLSSPKEVENEYRIVWAGEVVGSCQYMRRGEEYYSKVVPHNVLELAAEIGPQLDCDPVFVMDFTDAALLEVNSFSCAGLYECDTDIIVDKVNQIGQSEYGEYS